MDQLGLFPLAWHEPTTRGIAAAVGPAASGPCPTPDRRADHATYQEVMCRSALNRAKGMPFKWTLNPYRGCTHACHYCFARRYHAQFEMGAGDDFASVILVKTNFPEVLARELGKARRGRASRLPLARRPIRTSPSRASIGSRGGRWNTWPRPARRSAW